MKESIIWELNLRKTIEKYEHLYDEPRYPGMPGVAFTPIRDFIERTNQLSL